MNVYSNLSYADTIVDELICLSFTLSDPVGNKAVQEKREAILYRC